MVAQHVYNFTKRHPEVLVPGKHDRKLVDFVKLDALRQKVGRSGIERATTAALVNELLARNEKETIFSNDVRDKLSVEDFG